MVTSTTRLRLNRIPRIIELLSAASLRGVSITIVETGYSNEELRQMGIKIFHRYDCKMQCAIIDQHFFYAALWCGMIECECQTLRWQKDLRLQNMVRAEKKSPVQKCQSFAIIISYIITNLRQFLPSCSSSLY